MSQETITGWEALYRARHGGVYAKSSTGRLYRLRVEGAQEILEYSDDGKNWEESCLSTDTLQLRRWTTVDLEAGA